MPTELEAFRRDQAKWAGVNEGAARLSAKYCEAHRPKRHDGTFNPAYKRAIRCKAQFEDELFRLEKQSSTVSECRANSGNAGVDKFVFNIVARDGLYLDEEGTLRNIASSLAADKISDRKKEIVSLRASGMKAAEIARSLNISRQAVSKMLKSISSEYRFDVELKIERALKAVKMCLSSEASDATGEIVMAALEDTQIREFYSNCDGDIWAVFVDASTKRIGAICPAQSEKLISWVARTQKKQVNHMNPVLECELPEYGARFIATVPPVVKQASFSVRKKGVL